MHIFITGISGLIGRALSKALITEGYTVSGLSRSPLRAEKLLPNTIELISSFDQTPNSKIDIIINLAGEPIADKRWSAQRKQHLYSSRVDFTNHLVEWIKKHNMNLTAFISGSAVGYYGRHGCEALDEQAKPHHEYTYHLCHQWEQAALQLSPDTRVCILRTGLVLSHEGGLLQKLYFPFKLGLGGNLGSGEQYMSWIHIEDMVNGIIHLIKHPQIFGAFNFTAPYPVTNAEFTKTLASSLKRPAHLHQPPFVLKIIFGELSEILLTGQKVIPVKLSNSGFNFAYPKIHPALTNCISKM
ncbi:TIGR01777 family oxidoreductase [Teredinibacter sp. KSP-S5-2]|uniref:TIGR01777 family oxidoreductase n=1 Tax=Teredinibacter sp. KSP-S5-2 TaxID=3034506 RepID=UPI002934F2E7|nr:TIGR01777 family oxidoreductase [Teredinibacter sp. KSP-S5-2]WNO07583.1 TIGR01777 family oxidoreductase [Teredinibacter sp. KSP-S5-2]